MHGYDLLVHASRVETFGMTVVEAVAAGLPVLGGAERGPQGDPGGLGGRVGALMNVSEDPQVIVDAYRRLRAAVGDIDLPAAREVLEGRYGREPWAAQLMDAYRGTGTAEPTGKKAAKAAAEGGKPGTAPASRSDGPCCSR